MKTPITLPLNDPSQWPLRMTKAEAAHVMRRSVRWLERRVKQGTVPAPDADRFFLREEIAAYCTRTVRQFDRLRKRRTA